MASRAQDLYREIERLSDAERTAYIGRWIGKQIETEYLDFKSGKGADKDNKRIWSEALSGFANTEGGVLAWGIDARPVQLPGEPRKIDVATAETPLPNPASFRQLLIDTHRHATVEAVPGVEHLIVRTASGTDGFLITLVPEGTSKPYRASVDNVYYQRIGESFSPIPHSLLRTMFHPMSRARFHVKFVQAQLTALEAKLLNVGEATASDVYVCVFTKHGLIKVEYSRDCSLFATNSDKGARGQAERPIHPGQGISLARIAYAGDPKPTPFELDLFIAIFAKNQPAVYLRHSLSVVGVNELKDTGKVERLDQLEIL